MMGRKRKTGPRTKSGRLSRAKEAQPWQYGNDRVVELRARFSRFHDGKAAQQVGDPIGRAWAVGLLENDRIDPAALRDAGRRYGLRYWGHYPSASMVAGYDRDTAHGPSSVDGEDPAGRMFAAMDRMLGDAGRASRQAVQEIVVDHHWLPDSNPDWLERLINERLVRAGLPVAGYLQRDCDWTRMRRAVEGLMALAGEDAMRRVA